jgi:hypothetical protein
MSITVAQLSEMSEDLLDVPFQKPMIFKRAEKEGMVTIKFQTRKCLFEALKMRL